MGYAGPNAASNQLRTGRYGAIGLVFSEDLPYGFSDPMALAVMHGVALGCRAHKLDLTLMPEQNDAFHLERSTGLSLGSRPVDGYIMYSLDSDSRYIHSARNADIPTVVIDQPLLEGRSFVGIDDHNAGRVGARELLRLGHRRFGIASLKSHSDSYTGWVNSDRRASATYAIVAARLAGYLAELYEAGVRPEEIHIWEVAQNSERAGAEALRALLGADPKMTAVLAMSDRIGIGMVGEAGALGRTVPDDLSVLGFDDIPMAAQAGLASLKQSGEEKGRTAVELLLGPGTRSVILPTEFMARSSIGPCRPR